MCFTRNPVQKLRNTSFRNVSEPLNQCPLFHSNPLHSSLLHSATLSSETLQNNVRVSLWVNKKLIFVMCLRRREGPLSTNVLPGNVSDASTQRRGWETSQLRLLTLTPKRYKTRHVFISWLKKAYICNVSELCGKGMREHAQETPSAVAFQSYCDVISSSDS